MIIGITGSIATGKSLVANYFKDQGFKVINTDEINYHLLNEENHIKNINKLLFNIDSNILNKSNVRDLIFNNPDKKKELENYLHPIIYRIVIDEINLNKGNLTFVEVPLLYETNFKELVDKVIVVYADETTQINRLIKRDKISLEEAKLRINAQISLTDKVKLADYIIDNSKKEKHTFKQLKKLLEKLGR